MRIIIVTTRVPYPPHKGDKLKIYNIVRHLAGQNKVKVLCLSRGPSESELLSGIRALGAEIETVQHSMLRSLLGAFLGLFSRRPLQVSLYRSGKLGRRLAEIVRDEEPDVVYYHFIRSAQYIEYVDRNRTVNVLDFTDAVSLYLTRFIDAVRNPLTKFMIRFERGRISGYEHIAERFDTAFICSEFDRDYLKGKGIKANFQILPNAVDTESFSRSDVGVDQKRIIFTGNMPYFPNEDAVLHFTRKIFPDILAVIPDAKLFLVGRKPTRKIRKLASENVIVTGFVEDIVTEYQKSAVAIAPTRFGAGTLNKVIEPIVLGVPVVATSIAVRGLPARVQRYVQVAQSDAEFSAKVVELLKKGAEGRVSTVSELDEVRAALSWKTVVSEFETYLKSRTRPG